MNNTLINVGVAQIKLSNNPTILRTILGSCVGVCIYDKVKKIGGLAHVLLPSSVGIKDAILEKYADSAVPILIKQLLKSKGGIK